MQMAQPDHYTLEGAQMRSGTFAIYQGKEYRLADKDKGFDLVSENPDDQRLGFSHYFRNIYIKEISASQITDAYFVNTFCSYKGHRFEMWRQEDGKWIIDTMDGSLSRQLGLHERERGVYETWVSLDELDAIWEERRPVYDLPFLTEPVVKIK